VDQLRIDVGVAALVGAEQVAIFRLDANEIRAIRNLDPFSGASILSRGIVGSRAVVGSRDDAVFVASPMYKQAFDLRTGQCLDDPEVSVPTFEVRIADGAVLVLAPDGEAIQTTEPRDRPTRSRTTPSG